MGRAGGLLPLLCCLLLGVPLPGGTAETPDDEGALALPTPSHISPASGEPEIELSEGTTSPPLSSAPKDTGTVLSGTIGPEEVGDTTEAVAGTEGSESQADNSSKPSTTLVSSRGDTPAEVHGNTTAIAGPAPTEEVVPTDVSVTVEVVQTTENSSSAPPRDNAATPVVTQTISSTASEPISLPTNLTEASTQSPSEGVTSQNATDLGDATKAPPDVVASTTITTIILTSTITKALTTAASTTLIPSAEPTSKVAPEDGKHEPSVLNVGDDGKDIPGVTNRALSNTDPLVVAVISVFLVMVGILAVVGFLRYRQRNNRTEFRRLQDLPMDDMMEDTPLSLYSY